jgi:hypothetical protein
MIDGKYTGAFPERMEVRYPPGTLDAVDTLAKRRHTKRQYILRELVVEGLQARGFMLTADASAVEATA